MVVIKYYKSKNLFGVTSYKWHGLENKLTTEIIPWIIVTEK